MKTVWTKGLKAEAASELRKDFSACSLTRSRLKQMLEGSIAQSRKNARKEGTYDSPNWALVQADAIGYERALSDIISLL